MEGPRKAHKPITACLPADVIWNRPRRAQFQLPLSVPRGYLCTCQLTTARALLSLPRPLSPRPRQCGLLSILAPLDGTSTVSAPTTPTTRPYARNIGLCRSTSAHGAIASTVPSFTPHSPPLPFCIRFPCCCFYRGS
jgi:hypothetical protein